ALTAADLMSRPVQVIHENMPLQTAAHLLSQARITGAPVVDSDGRCIGVLSATDFMHWAEKGGRAEQVRCATPECVCSDWQVMEVEYLPKDEVRWYMSDSPITVKSCTPIGVLARTMLDAHIHRVVVVDPERRPVGVVSVTDVVAAVAWAAKPNPKGEDG